MLPLLPIIVACAIPCAAILGWLGWTDRLPFIRESFADATMRPANLRCVYAMHLGGYVGGAVGIAIVCAQVARLRRRSLPPVA